MHVARQVASSPVTAAADPTPRQASVMAKMDAARRDLLAATMECGPHVHVGKEILAAVTKFARLEHVPEAISPRDFGVDWKTPAKADLPRM